MTQHPVTPQEAREAFPLYQYRNGGGVWQTVSIDMQAEAKRLGFDTRTLTAYVESVDFVIAQQSSAAQGGAQLPLGGERERRRQAIYRAAQGGEDAKDAVTIPRNVLVWLRNEAVCDFPDNSDGARRERLEMLAATDAAIAKDTTK